MTPAKFKLYKLFYVCMLSACIESSLAQPNPNPEPKFGLGEIWDISYSNDLNLVATAGSRGVVIWDSKAAKIIDIIEGTANTVLLSSKWAFSCLY